MPKIKNQLPSASDAEKWVNPDMFVYKGKLYAITPDFKVVEVKNTKDDKEK